MATAVAVAAARGIEGRGRQTEAMMCYLYTAQYYNDAMLLLVVIVMWTRMSQSVRNNLLKRISIKVELAFKYSSAQGIREMMNLTE